MGQITQAGGGNVGRMFATQAQRWPDDIALVCCDDQLTYSQLNDRVNRLAHVMGERGVKHGDRVGLLAHNCAEYIEVELAAAKIGAITVALNWRLSPGELDHCLALTTPDLLLTQPGFLEDRDSLDFGPAYEAALAGAANSEPHSAAGGEDGLVIIFTSGTTGLPKGALISHRAIIARTAIFGAETGAPAKDTFVAWTPLFHMGSNDFTYATLLRGGKVIVVDGYQPQLLADIIEREAVHYLT
ncbi:MAG: long-chain fatty acid--CoA ligase, partial [Rhodospirillaceae bacterium]|nr:long-chain fatty acid--CoA ligase [Rhodospirillaceae bacterium]